MGATASPPRRPTRIDLTPEEFERRLVAHGHDSREIDALWSELVGEAPVGQAEPSPGIGGVISVYLGLLLLVAASVSLVALYWHELGAGGVLVVAGVYLGGYLASSELLRRRNLGLPADVLEAVSVGWVGLATFAVAELTGYWPENAGDSGEIHRGLTAIALVVVATSLLFLVVRPDPLLLVPLAAASAVLAVDLAELAFGATMDDLGERQRVAFLLPVGLAWIAAGLWLDATRRRGYATWAHWCGLVITGAAVIALIPKTVPGFALLGVLGACALFVSTFVQHWSFTILGALGVLIATTSALGRLGALATIAVAVAGIALVVTGLRHSQRHDPIRSAMLARLPAGVREWVERLAP